MRGQEDIIRMRKERKRPSIVFVNDYPCRTDWSEYGEHATVCTFGDGIESIDFRFLTGLRVSITGANEKRAKALMSLAKEAGATTVGSASGDWAEVWHKEENNG